MKEKLAEASKAGEAATLEGRRGLTWLLSGVTVIWLGTTAPSAGQLPPPAEPGSVDVTFDVLPWPSAWCAGSPLPACESIPASWTEVCALVVQPDGGVLIGGVDPSGGRGLIRLNPDGTEDTGFTRQELGAIYAVALQPGGRILVGGQFSFPWQGIANVVQLGPDGGLDPAFNAQVAGRVYALALEASGRVIIGGAFTAVNGIARQRVARLEPDGTLDATFDPGMVIDSAVRAILVQEDGSVLLAGDLYTGYGDARSGVIRLRPDGSLDESFDLQFDNVTRTLAPLPGGGFLVGGPFTTAGGMVRPGVARFHADGTIDPSLDLRLGFSNAYLDVTALAVQSNGQLLLGGTFNDDGYPWHGFTGVARVRPDGSRDLSFETRVQTYDPDDVSPRVNAVVVEADGQVLVGGFFDLVNEVPRHNCAHMFPEGHDCPGYVDFAVGTQYIDENAGAVVVAVNRYGGTSGTLTITCSTADDEAVAGADYTTHSGVLTFDPGETAKTFTIPLLNDPLREANEFFTVQLGALSGPPPFRGPALPRQHVLIVDDENAGQPGNLDREFRSPFTSRTQVDDVAWLPDGRLVIAGRFHIIGEAVRPCVARLGADGALDPSFHAPPIEAFSIVLAVAAEPSGNVLIGGYFSRVGGVSRNGIARLNPDGSLDLTFDPGTGLGIGSGDQWAVREILLLPDGRVLIAGSFDRYDGTPCPSLARLLPDGSLDTTLSASLSWSSRSPWLTAMVLQPDGKIVVGGLLDRANGLPVESIVRLNPDGSTDPAFRQGLGNNSGVRGLALQPDGKLVIAGDLSFEDGRYSRLLARLLPDGSVDPAFRCVTEEQAHPYQIAVQPDGKIVVACGFHELHGVPLPGLARLHPDGAVDEEFFPGAGIDSGGQHDARCFVGPDSHVFLVGAFDTFNHLPSIAIARVHATALSFAQRQLPPHYVAGVPMTVRLEVRPAAGTGAYAVEDQPPTGWVVSNISHDGLLDGRTGRVKFGPFFDAEARFLRYSVTPPANATGAQCFEGLASADGINSPVAGPSCMSPLVEHPADTLAPLFSLAIGEVTAYGGAWRRGQPWPVPPNPIPIDYVTRAAALWRGGECYTVDSRVTNAPLWWVSCASSSNAAYTPAAEQFRPAGLRSASVATRQAPSNYVPGEAVSVTITVAPPAGALAYAVEEAVPPGWAIASLGQGGEQDAVGGKLKWGPFFDKGPSTLSYVVLPPPSADGLATFRGAGSIDGVSAGVSGVDQMASSCRMRVGAGEPGGAWRLSLAGVVGAVYVVEASADLADWTPLATLTNTTGRLEFSDPTAASHRQRFYRARRIQCEQKTQQS